MCVVFDKGLNDLGYSYSIFKNNCLGDSYTMDLCNLFHNNLKEFNNQFTEKKIRNL